MFTNEFDWDETITTILDETAQYEDVEVIIDEEGVFIRQFRSDDQPADVISLSHEMLEDMIQAMNQPEGMFKLK